MTVLFFFIADLAFRAGRIEEALERATVLMENPKLDDKTRARTNYLFARIFQHMGDPVNERAALEAVIADGPAAGLMLEVQEAQSRLDELAQSDS